MTSRTRPAAGWLYLAAFIALGVCLSMLGPALTYLRERAHVSKGDIGVLFVASSLGYLAGSRSCARFYDRGFGHRALAGGLLGVAVALTAIPHVTSVAALAVPFAVMGFSGGCVDVGGNTLVVWHTRAGGSARLLNALHLFFGIGALLSPGLVNRSLAWTGGLGPMCNTVAVYAVVVAVVLLVHEAPVHGADEDGGDVDAGVGTSSDAIPTRILAVFATFFFLYVGIEIGFSGWITTYAQGVHVPGANSATWLNTLFWLSFTVGRLAAVVVGKRVRPGTILAASCSLTVVLLTVMAVANGAAPAVWITTPLIGIAVAPQFATMIAYAEERVTLSGRATSWLVSGSGLGGLVLPLLWLLVVRRALRGFGRPLAT